MALLSRAPNRIRLFHPKKRHVTKRSSSKSHQLGKEDKKMFKRTVETAPRARVLSVSPLRRDHERLRAILASRCIVSDAANFHCARGLLEAESFAIVVCEQNLTPYTWRDVLAEVAVIPTRPLVVVTSRLADDYLWSEALNLGAYDVLAKPFVALEVTRTINAALLHWKYQNEPTKKRVRAAGQGG
jgi:DNA-binding NtrC family response regulator